MSDELFFYDDEPDVDHNVGIWNVLIVDDDSDIHDTTTMVISGYRVDGKSVTLHHCYSCSESLEYLKQHPEIDLIFMDVVMETPHAGLEAVDAIRELKTNSTVRIVLRTGQPGNISQLSVLENHLIDGYLLKTASTREVLLGNLITQLRTSDLMRRNSRVCTVLECPVNPNIGLNDE